MTRHSITRVIGSLLIVMLSACGSNKSTTLPTEAESALLLSYLENNGDILNGPGLPSLINAEDVHRLLYGTNIHIIDLREADAFNAGHIPHSVNVLPSEVLYHFEYVIDPLSFEYIVLVCPDAMLSGYVNAVMLFLGYDNVYALRYGLSSWDMEVAQDYWLAAMSSHLENKLETTFNPKNKPGPLPALATGETNGYRILRKRAEEILNIDPALLDIDLDSLLHNPDIFYLVNYWPMGLYEQGHLPGAIQYTPKLSLRSDQDINTLPVGQTIAIYCFTGHHSSYVTAFLRLLGYEAVNFSYGANAFIYHTMLTTQVESRTFTENHVHNYPLTGRDEVALPAQRQDEPLPIIGGC